ncbi:MAG TPA: hypothetical protein VKX46_07195 [Ktedonobacteraceae bacterium]|jgi:hypothetical protein|nr:hypothetical protein [Ktedonobacteraceae bacterium]
MRCRGARDRFVIQRASHLARSEENENENYPDAGSPGLEQRESPGPSPSYRCPGISTERIMQAVDRQRRISQQLDDLRVQQKRRTEFLRAVGLRVVAIMCYVSGVLAASFVVLLLLRPELLARTVDFLGNGLAVLLMVEEEIRLGLSLIPAGSWLLSGMALVVVLLMGLWLHLMRPPREA